MDTNGGLVTTLKSFNNSSTSTGSLADGPVKTPCLVKSDPKLFGGYLLIVVLVVMFIWGKVTPENIKKTNETI